MFSMRNFHTLKLFACMKSKDRKLSNVMPIKWNQKMIQQSTDTQRRSYHAG